MDSRQMRRLIRRRRTALADTVISGADLRAAARSAGLKSAEIARRMGVTRQYVFKLERLDEVPVETAERYLAALGERPQPVG